MRKYVEPSTYAVDGYLWQNDEVELVRGKRVNAKLLIIIFAIIGALFVVGFLSVGIIDRASTYNNHSHDLYCYSYDYGYYTKTETNEWGYVSTREYYNIEDIVYAKYGTYDVSAIVDSEDFSLNCYFGTSATDYIFDGFFDEGLLPCLAIYAVWMLIALIIWLILSRCEMVVTNYRICGRAMFGRRVDLPLDSVTATGTIRWLRRVSVSTSSGWISFGFIRNSNEVFSIITQTVIARQRIKAGAPQKPAATIDEM